MNGEHPLAAGGSTVTSTCGFHAEHLKHPRAWLGTQHRRAGRHTDPKRTGAPCTVPHPGAQAGPSPGPGSPHRQPSNCWRDEPSEETTEEVVVSGPRRHPPGLAPGRCVGTRHTALLLRQVASWSVPPVGLQRDMEAWSRKKHLFPPACSGFLSVSPAVTVRSSSHGNCHPQLGAHRPGIVITL